MKKFVLLMSFALTLAAGWADDTRVDGKGDGKGGGDFSGTITAIETSRDSFTVENEAGQVKMFSVSADRKSQLSIGEKVTVSYTDAYSWPLHTSRISVSHQ